jgi:hypothetical protein
MSEHHQTGLSATRERGPSAPVRSTESGEA